MIDFKALQTEELQSRIKNYPKHIQRASDLGHECERRAYYSIARWQDKMPHDPVLQSIFDLGNKLEEFAIERIKKYRGLNVIHTQAEYVLENPKISMHIDGALKIEEPNEYIDEPVGSTFAFDVKSMSPWDWSKLQKIEDFTQSKKHHQRMYVAQLQLYLLGRGQEKGYLCPVNKLTGLVKFVEGRIDIDFCDSLLKKAERIDKALKENKEPDRIDNFDICSSCAWRHICLPTASFEAVKIMDREELAAKLNELDQLKPSVKRYKELDNEVKESMKAEGQGQYIVDEFAVKVSKRKRDEFTVKASEWLEVRIARLK